ncbi:AAA family ATPase [Ileibacterium valens]|uniref:AAA family ATPase n=1 Tax=Ileibacterium valens TaxID=1862668 RepID=UPI002572FEDF|nr:AAA family ATPase [Ileibacterium valens]
MFNQNNFKDLLYDAYGVCSYLSAWEAADLQNILNDELLEFAFDANPENSPVIKEIESLLLYRDEDFPEKHIQKIKLRKMASKKLNQNPPAKISASEFEWAESRMRVQNPNLSYSPFENLVLLFEQAANENEQALEKLKPLIVKIPERKYKFDFLKENRIDQADPSLQDQMSQDIEASDSKREDSSSQSKPVNHKGESKGHSQNEADPLQSSLTSHNLKDSDHTHDLNKQKIQKNNAHYLNTGLKPKFENRGMSQQKQEKSKESQNEAISAKTPAAKDYLGENQMKKMSDQIAEILKELDCMTGLESVKEQVHSLANYLLIQKIRQELGLKNPVISRHMIFYGNPGTGKTTVARLLAKIFRELGLLKKGQLIETDRSGLVAGYIGQTAQKTQEMIQKALGGILFIDEAYSLIRESPNDFGREAVETILKAMEDHRDDLVVIAAGYPALMDDFLLSNPGLASRFGTRIRFENYSPLQLRQIASDLARAMDYTIDKEALDLLEHQVENLLEQSDGTFGNARTVRNLIEKAMMAQANRLIMSNHIDPEELSTLYKEDFEGN